MMRLRVSPLVLGGIAALAAANVWLLSTMIKEIVIEDNAVADEASWIPRLEKFDAAPINALPASGHQDILGRPVFSRSRAPFVPAPPPQRPGPVPAPVVADPGFVLGGVMENGETKKAYLQQKTNRNGAWVSEGENFLGWRVQSVTSQSARLEKDSHIIEVRLYTDR